MDFKKPYTQYEGKWISYDGDVAFVIKFIEELVGSLRFAVIKEGAFIGQGWLTIDSEAFITKASHPYKLIKSIFHNNLPSLDRIR